MSGSSRTRQLLAMQHQLLLLRVQQQRLQCALAVAPLKRPFDGLVGAEPWLRLGLQLAGWWHRHY
jgi:hypothetical protein